MTDLCKVHITVGERKQSFVSLSVCSGSLLEGQGFLFLRFIGSLEACWEDIQYSAQSPDINGTATSWSEVFEMLASFCIIWLAGEPCLELPAIKPKETVFWRQLCGPVWCVRVWFPRGQGEVEGVFSASSSVRAVPRDILRLCWRAHCSSSADCNVKHPISQAAQCQLLVGALQWLQCQCTMSPRYPQACGHSWFLCPCRGAGLCSAAQLFLCKVLENLPRSKMLLTRHAYMSFTEGNLAYSLHKCLFLGGVFTCWNKCVLPVSISSQIKSLLHLISLV